MGTVMSKNSLSSLAYGTVRLEVAMASLLIVEIPCTAVCRSSPKDVSDVWGSTSRCRLKSISRPWFAMKSAPMMGMAMSAIVNGHWKMRHKPRLSVSSCWPYVRMTEEFAA